VTLGIAPVEPTLEAARRHLAAGFRCLKVKIGLDPAADLRRLVALRRLVGPEIILRVDANQGYDLPALRRLGRRLSDLDLELVEQPLATTQRDTLRTLDPALRGRIALDEDLVSERDALDLATREPLCGIFNIKLMKCGGIAPAMAIARLAASRNLELMWGCMDESRLGIAAALHAASASPATRYLDLDGSFDLTRDPARGGFELVDGRLHLLDRPGLGVDLEEVAD
jgi:L-alanine-DL-glutamate epimerase-like enolase superfamily enzyme